MCRLAVYTQLEIMLCTGPRHHVIQGVLGTSMCSSSSRWRFIRAVRFGAPIFAAQSSTAVQISAIAAEPSRTACTVHAGCVQQLTGSTLTWHGELSGLDVNGNLSGSTKRAITSSIWSSVRKSQ